MKKNIIITLITLVVFAVLIWVLLPNKPDIPKVYTESELKLKLSLQGDSLNSYYLEEKLKSNELIRIELGGIITDLQESQKKLKATSSKQETIIKELRGKFVTDNSIETCKALVNAQEIQLYNKQTEIDSITKQVDYWCMLQDSTEVALDNAKVLIDLKNITIKDISSNATLLQYQLNTEAEKNKELEDKIKKRRGNFWKGLGTGILGSFTYNYFRNK